MASIFKKIKEAKIVGGNGNYFGPGDFKVKILECKEIESQEKDGVSYFGVETVVLQCSDDARLAPPRNSPPGTEGPVCKRGDKVTWLLNMSLKPSLGNVKQFVKACDPECDEDDIDEAMCEEIVSAAQPLAGLYMKIRAWNKPTKEGNEFTRVWWEFDDAPPADLNHTEQAAFDEKQAAEKESQSANANKA